MFTGIIEELGTIRGVSLTKDGGELQIAATTVLGGTKLGDSIAVNGTCLTVTKLEKDGFTAFVMAESLRRTNLGSLKRGSVVHLERAMAADGRFGGHMVTGHIDGQGTFLSQKPEGQAVVLTIGADPEILSGIVEKGSIAIDGHQPDSDGCGQRQLPCGHHPPHRRTHCPFRPSQRLRLQSGNRRHRQIHSEIFSKEYRIHPQEIHIDHGFPAGKRILNIGG